MAGLLKGGCRWLKRQIATSPVGSGISTTMLRSLRSTGCRSAVGCSHQSISPLVRALEAVAASGITVHSIRSKCASFGPTVQFGVPSLRGT